MLNKSGDSGHLSLVPDFRANGFKFFTIKCDVSCRFITHSLYNIEVESFYS
jgi:hypothetical protein